MRSTYSRRRRGGSGRLLLPSATSAPRRRSDLGAAADPDRRGRWGEARDGSVSTCPSRRACLLSCCCCVRFRDERFLRTRFRINTELGSGFIRTTISLPSNSASQDAATPTVRPDRSDHGHGDGAWVRSPGPRPNSGLDTAQHEPHHRQARDGRRRLLLRQGSCDVVVVVRFLETHTQALGRWDNTKILWCVTVLRSSGSRSSWPFALFFLLFSPKKMMIRLVCRHIVMRER